MKTIITVCLIMCVLLFDACTTMNMPLASNTPSTTATVSQLSSQDASLANLDAEFNIFFPQLKPVVGERPHPQARLNGQLELVNGCLRIQDGYSSRLVIWFPQIKLDVNDNIVSVHDTKTQVVKRVGETITVGGSEVGGGNFFTLLFELSEPLPKECPGPYLLAGMVIE